MAESWKRISRMHIPRDSQYKCTYAFAHSRIYEEYIGERGECSQESERERERDGDEGVVGKRHEGCYTVGKVGREKGVDRDVRVFIGN